MFDYFMVLEETKRVETTKQGVIETQSFFDVSSPLCVSRYYFRALKEYHYHTLTNGKNCILVTNSFFKCDKTRSKLQKTIQKYFMGDEISNRLCIMRSYIHSSDVAHSYNVCYETNDRTKVIKTIPCEEIMNISKDKSCRILGVVEENITTHKHTLLPATEECLKPNTKIFSVTFVKHAKNTKC